MAVAPLRSQTAHAAGCYVAPFLYRLNHRPDARCLRDEVFGPHLAIIPFKTNDEAAAIYNDTDYGLSMAVVTEDYRAMRFFREECEYGLGYVNLPCIGAEVHLPFGGTKATGNGHHEAGTAALDVFSEWKSIYIDFSGKLQRAQIDVEQI